MMDRAGKFYNRFQMVYAYSSWLLVPTCRDSRYNYAKHLKLIL